MNAHEYVDAKRAAEAIEDAAAYWAERRRIKTARQLYLTRQRRTRDPQWWADKMTREAEARRERYWADPDYRARRLSQSHTGRYRLIDERLEA